MKFELLKEILRKSFKKNVFGNYAIKIYSKLKKKVEYSKIVNMANFPKPRNSLFFLTMRCNLNCQMCHQKEFRAKNLNKLHADELSLGQIKKAISSLKKFGIKKVCLTGGEILLREDLFKILECIKENRMSIEFGTNGTLITESIAEKLNNYPIVSISLSLDGLQESHDKIRGRIGAFNKTLNAIKILAKKFDVNINFVLQKENIRDAEKVIKLCDELGVKSFGLTYPIQNMRGRQVKDTLKVIGSGQVSTSMQSNNVTIKEFFEVYERLKNINARIEINPILKDSSNCDILNLESKKLICTARNMLFLDYNGDIIPCSFIRMSMGNILTDNIDDVWNSKKFKEFRRSAFIGKMLPVCKNCYCGLDFI
jgi:MoaA/NifB/PqqE/SkfB family radical SAM enzyme